MVRARPGTAEGHLDLRSESRAPAMEHDGEGRVTGVVHAGRDGERARAAGDATDGPRFLASSASARFPGGLAHSSRQGGRNQTRHGTGSVHGHVPEPARMRRGTTMAGIVRDEARHDPSRGFAGGCELETPSPGPPFVAAFLDPGARGREFAPGGGP